MTGPLDHIPADLAGEYSQLSLARQTSEAFVYRARDGLGDTVTITETFPQTLCQREPDGTVSAKPQQQATWTSFLSDCRQRSSLWSRLVHPALCGIDQIHETNGTLYVVTRDADGQTLDRRLPDIPKILEPRQIQVASEGLIDLLAYLHAFGVLGLRIVPEALILEDQDAMIFLSLQRFLEGAVSLSKASESGEVEDGKTLARTLHRILRGKDPTLPYKPMAGDRADISAGFLTALDRVVSQDPLQSNFTAREWKARVENTIAPARRRKLKRLVPIAAALLLGAVGLAGWYGISQRPHIAASSGTANHNAAVSDAGPWQLQLPLQIVRDETAQDRFMLKLTASLPEFTALNPWVRNGLVVTEINGAPVVEPVNLRALSMSTEASTDDVALTSLTIKDPHLPLQRNVAVVPYFWREKTYGAVRLREQVAIDGWQLTVTEISHGAKLPLEAGDLLVREQVEDLPLRRFSDLDSLLRELDGTANASLTLMIRRKDGSRRDVGFAVERLLTTRVRGSDE